MEADAIERSPRPVTAAQLAADLRAAGLPVGGTVIAHTAMSRLGWVPGGAQAVVDGLTEALGPDGTLVMPTQSGQLSDPASWANPPVPESWWEEIRAAFPAYDPRATPTRGMGAVPECFRGCRGVLRSAHPLSSFAARGPLARRLLEPHPLDYGVGEGSPLSGLYEVGGHVLLLGVGHGSNTTLHLAEHRSGRGRETTESAPVRAGGGRRWTSFRALDWDVTDFARLGADYRAAGRPTNAARVGLADAQILPVVPLIDFAIPWLTHHRPPRTR